MGETGWIRRAEAPGGAQFTKTSVDVVNWRVGNSVENPFVRRLEAGALMDREDLQACFRQTAKLVHPDTSPYTKDHRAFAKLKTQFEEALLWLEDRGAQVPPREDKTDPSLKPLSETERRESFLWALQSLLARGWPLTRGRETHDPSLRRHLSQAQLCFDAWLPDHHGLFRELEACRIAMLKPAAQPPTSAATAWQQMMVFLNSLLWGWSFPGPNSRNLVAREAQEALQKAKRRAAMEPAERFISLLVEELVPPERRSGRK